MEQQSWKSLFRGYAARAQDAESRRERERALDAWYDEHAKQVMGLVRDVAAERVAQFEKETGLHVEVKWPSHPPINAAPEGPFMSFMSLRLEDSELHLYSHRLPQRPPAIHFVLLGAGEQRRKRPQLASHAGCRIERREGGGFRLVDLRREQPAAELSVDDLVFRAFELLLAS